MNSDSTESQTQLESPAAQNVAIVMIPPSADGVQLDKQQSPSPPVVHNHYHYNGNRTFDNRTLNDNRS